MTLLHAPRARWALLVLFVLACGDPGPTADPDGSASAPGTLTLLVEPEDSITRGVLAGEGPADMHDGWSASFDAYYVTLGPIEVRRSSDPSVTARAPQLHVVDLQALGSAGLSIWTIEDLEAGRWDLFFETGRAASGGAIPHPTVSAEAHDTMVANDWSYWVTGAIEKAGGESCPPDRFADPASGIRPNGNTNARGDACYDAPQVAFDWGGVVEARYGPCTIDDVPGFAMPAGGSQTIATSIHGDHIFFNGFPEGDESGVTRLAQWIADADLNLDGAVSRGELERLAPADLAAIDERYALGGAPIVLTTMWDYVVAQLQTQAHYQGEGECPADVTP